MGTAEIVLKALIEAESKFNLRGKKLKSFYRSIINEFGTDIANNEELNEYLEEIIGDTDTIDNLPAIAGLNGSLKDEFNDVRVRFEHSSNVYFSLRNDLREKYSSVGLKNRIDKALSEHSVVSEGRGGPYSFIYSHKNLPEIWVGAYRN